MLWLKEEIGKHQAYRSAKLEEKCINKRMLHGTLEGTWKYIYIHHLLLNFKSETLTHSYRCVLRTLFGRKR